MFLQNQVHRYSTEAKDLLVLLGCSRLIGGFRSDNSHNKNGA